MKDHILGHRKHDYYEWEHDPITKIDLYQTQISASTSFNLSGKAIVGFSDTLDVSDGNSSYNNKSIISGDKKLCDDNICRKSKSGILKKSWFN